MHLCVLIGVDSDTKTVFFAKEPLSNEPVPSFEFAIKHFVKSCGGHPEVGRSRVLLG